MPAEATPKRTIDDALAMLKSAFPLTPFRITNGQITAPGIVVAPGLITGAPLAMVRIVAAQLKAIEDEQAAAAKKAADDAAKAAEGQSNAG